MKIHVILLAAGNSRRFAGNKLLYKYQGKPLYRWTLDTWQKVRMSRGIQLLGETILVSQYEELLLAAEAYGCLAVVNRHPERGISYSIRLGLEKLRDSVVYQTGDAAVFCVCDQPELRAETLEGFLGAYAESGRGIGCVTCGEQWGNPVIFRDIYWEELERLSGDTGGKVVLQTHIEDVMWWETDAQELHDIDERRDVAHPPVLVRGGGDLATGVLHLLHRKGYRVLALETSCPACIRRQVSFSEAVYEGKTQVDGVTAVHVETVEEIYKAWEERNVPVAVDPSGRWIWELRPEIVVDAILAKKNLGTKKEMAPLVIALGPGFEAGEEPDKDADAVIETMRGESLGRIYRKGKAIPNTGVPGVIAGVGAARVIHALADGIFRPVKEIGESVKEGELLGEILNEDLQDPIPVCATIPGILRGQIRPGYPVTKGLKIMDIEPRCDNVERCFHISDKAQCIARSVYKVIREYEDCKTRR